MRYSVGQRESISIAGLVDKEGVPVTGETLTGFCLAPDGTAYELTSTGDVNDYEVLLPTFTMPGRWPWWVTGTTPNVGFQGECLVDYSPAASFDGSALPVDGDEFADGGEI